MDGNPWVHGKSRGHGNPVCDGISICIASALTSVPGQRCVNGEFTMGVTSMASESSTPTIQLNRSKDIGGRKTVKTVV